MRKALSLVLAFVILVSLFGNIVVSVNAASFIDSSPYAKIEYAYSTSTPAGTIRYISQDTSSSYFYSAYWPSSSFGGYSGPGSECGTACMSMALSYVGVNKTPNEILTPYNGYTMFVDWGDAKHISPSFSNAVINYVN